MLSCKLHLTCLVLIWHTLRENSERISRSGWVEYFEKQMTIAYSKRSHGFSHASKKQKTITTPQSHCCKNFLFPLATFSCSRAHSRRVRVRGVWRGTSAACARPRRPRSGAPPPPLVAGIIYKSTQTGGRRILHDSMVCQANDCTGSRRKSGSTRSPKRFRFPWILCFLHLDWNWLPTYLNTFTK